MFTLLENIKLGAAALAGLAVGGLLAYQVGHWNGEDYGRSAERQAVLKRSMELIRERNETNAEIDAMDDDALCVELDGRMRDGVCE